MLGRYLTPSLMFAVLACSSERSPRAQATPAETSPPAAPATAPSGLTTAEAATLRHMREEEKVAHDVYATLAAKGVAFTRIHQAERRHFDVIGWQLEKYGVPDPSAGKAVGELEDTELQTFYTALVERGSRGWLDGLAVGLEIEERDIVDLQHAIDQTTHQDLEQVYGNLQRASRNHLRAFHRELIAAGGSYTPKYLDRATFDRITSEPIEPGGMSSGMMLGRGGPGMRRGQGRGMGPGNCPSCPMGAGAGSSTPAPTR